MTKNAWICLFLVFWSTGMLILHKGGSRQYLKDTLTENRTLLSKELIQLLIVALLFQASPVFSFNRGKIEKRNRRATISRIRTVCLWANLEALFKQPQAWGTPQRTLQVPEVRESLPLSYLYLLPSLTQLPNVLFCLSISY